MMLAEHGAKVVVNDLGGAMDGSGDVAIGPAEEVAAEIRALGGQAVANTDNVADWEGAQRMINQAVSEFGGLDAVINNAGILRDRMLTNMTESEWDAVINVHLKGTFAPSRWAAAYWRERAKAGETNDARIINTTSVSGIFGNPGQTNYGAAKAGIASFTVIAAQELHRYGVTVNAISPGALTRMTENLGMGQLDDEGKAAMDPRWIAPIATWLTSTESAPVTGRVFLSSGREFGIANTWHRGPVADTPPADPTEMGAVVQKLMAEAQPNSNMAGKPATGPGYPTPY